MNLEPPLPKMVACRGKPPRNTIVSSRRVADQLKAGGVWVNTFGLFDAGIPSGGFKETGYGRDNIKHAIDAFTELNAVRVLTQ